jgi:hypothetical protein
MRDIPNNKWAKISVKQASGRPSIWYSGANGTDAGYVLKTISYGSGEAEWKHPSSRIISTIQDITATLSTQEVIIYTQSNSSATVGLILPNDPIFCGREIQLVRKGTLLGGQIMVTSTANIIQDRNTGTYSNSFAVSGNRSYLCDCTGGTPLWLVSSGW